MKNVEISFELEDRKYCSEPILHQIGVISHCYKCKSDSYIDFNCCDKPKIYTNVNNILCVSCKNIVPNTSENDKMIFKVNDIIIKKKSKNMYNKFCDYASYPEIKDLSLDEKICIWEIIDIIIINQLKLPNFEIKLISYKYMLLRILNMFGININEKLCYSKKLIDLFENRFHQLIRYSFYDIVNELGKKCEINQGLIEYLVHFLV